MGCNGLLVLCFTADCSYLLFMSPKRTKTKSWTININLFPQWTPLGLRPFPCILFSKHIKLWNCRSFAPSGSFPVQFSLVSLSLTDYVGAVWLWLFNRKRPTLIAEASINNLKSWQRGRHFIGHRHGDAQWNLLSTLDPSSCEEQWAAACVQHLGTRSTSSSVHLLEGTDWILT